MNTTERGKENSFVQRPIIMLLLARPQLRENLPELFSYMCFFWWEEHVAENILAHFSKNGKQHLFFSFFFLMHFKVQSPYDKNNLKPVIAAKMFDITGILQKEIPQY